VKAKSDESVKLTIHDFPFELLEDFTLKVVARKYPGGLSEALLDLMRQAVEVAEAEMGVEACFLQAKSNSFT
jgi:hypothetical protein